MIQSLRVFVLMAGIMLLPGSVVALEPPAYGEQEPVIAPAVVRQGDFALRLARVLALSTATADEDEAVEALTAHDIQPVQGWKVDEPVTPTIVAELHKTVTDAAAAGRLEMNAEEAASAFTQLVAELGLPYPADLAPGYAEAGAPSYAYAPSCDAGALDYYYGRYGPPLYTYCYPPPAYYYMYYWVPHGFYWRHHHFAGFFILKHVHVSPRIHHHRHIVDGHDGKKHRHDHKHHKWTNRPILQSGAAVLSPPREPPRVPSVGDTRPAPTIGREIPRPHPRAGISPPRPSHDNVERAVRHRPAPAVSPHVRAFVKSHGVATTPPPMRVKPVAPPHTAPRVVAPVKQHNAGRHEKAERHPSFSHAVGGPVVTTPAPASRRSRF
jgi:hypothetical protein